MVTAKSLFSVFSRFRDIVAVLVFVLIWIFSGSILKAVLGLVLFFIPGYGLTRFIFRYEKRDAIDFIVYTAMISFSVMPLLGNLVQVIVQLSSYSLLLATLAFSVPLLVFSDMKSSKATEAEPEPRNRNYILKKALAFFGSIGIGLGLYIQSSIGTTSPRGWDIFSHMQIVNQIISTGEAVIYPSLNSMSNFYHFAYASLSLLTGLDVPLTGVLGQSILAVLFMMSIFYFAYYVTGSLTASLIGAVLFIAGPPLYSIVTAYYWYFHPMYLALAILPFALVCYHEAMSGERKKSLGLTALLVCAVTLCHLTVGITLLFIMFFDFVLLLAKSRQKVLIVNFSKICLGSFFISSAVTIPFLVNLTNPFKYVYPQGGLQTLYTMFFGVSRFVLYSSAKGPDFLARILTEFSGRILPLLIIGVPGLLYLLIKKRSPSILVFSCILTGLLGFFQPLIGLGFMPQRFSEALILFGSILVGAFVPALAFYLKSIRSYLGRKVPKNKISLKMPSLRLPKPSVLILMVLVYIALFSYIVFFSPAHEAVLAAELEVRESDMVAIKEIAARVPRGSKVLMDPYLQFFFIGITGRYPLYSSPPTVPFYAQWDLYPQNVYVGRGNLSSIGVDYVVISPWCYTNGLFVGKKYFDQQGNLVKIYEFSVEKGPKAAYSGVYAVYQVME